MLRVIAAIVLIACVAPLAGCVVAPYGPRPYVGAVWVPGHYGPYGRWIHGHWA